MILRRLVQALGDPGQAAQAVKTRLNPRGMFDQYANLARSQGIDQPYFVLSFDCDTEDDIAVVWDVHSRLIDMGVTAVYAVPGDLLRKGEKIYRRIAETGAPFINHGDTEHTYFDVELGRHASCFFYDQLPEQTVRADIVAGDATLREVLGVQPSGYRTPHFGTYQKPSQLAVIHDTIEGLGYGFSTSTVPLYGLRFGPAPVVGRVREIPVSGMVKHPTRILDTWGCFTAPDRVMEPKDYFDQGVAMGRLMVDLGRGVLNYYADPIHIHDQEIFFETIGELSRLARSVTYDQLLETLS